MQALQLSAEVTTASLNKLGKHAEGIGQIMAIISAIADQTNLLSLNASIEAARAGDAGRGFTVVAEEVRKLAEKTADATRAVSDVVIEIQSETKNSVHTMEMTAHAVDETMVLSEKARGALVEIRESVTRSAEDIQSIAAASQQQIGDARSGRPSNRGSQRHRPELGRPDGAGVVLDGRAIRPNSADRQAHPKAEAKWYRTLLIFSFSKKPPCYSRSTTLLDGSTKSGSNSTTREG